jgi:raffinose/stachyose/melibiose transport system permease protein
MTIAPPVKAIPAAPASQPVRQGAISWMALPALLMFVAFGVVPLFGVLVLSFTTWDGIGDIRFSGFDSWRTVFTTPGLGHSLWVTFQVTFLSWAFQTPVSLLLGVFLAAHKRYRAVLAVLFFIPLLLSQAAIAIMFKSLLDQDWLGRPTLALFTVVFVVSWQFIPFHTLIYQGGVRQIPVSLYEAAQLDGAGRVRQFFSITLPQLKYTIITSSTLIIVGSLTFFDIIWVLTAGGPGDATRALALDMYIRGFRGSAMGPASVIAVILVLVGLFVAWLLRRLSGADRGDSQLEGA